MTHSPHAHAPDLPLGIGVIGAGFGRKIHIPGLQAYPGTRVLGIYHPDAAKAAGVAAEFDLPCAWHQLESMLADPAVDGITVATPPHVHFEVTRQALLAGKHVLLEKPLTLNVQQACHLYQLAQANKRVVVPDFEFRCVPEWLHLKALLDQGWAGSLRSVHLTWQVQSRANPDRPWNWYAQRALAGGALGAIGSHAFDMVAWLLGPVRRMLAHLTTRIPRLRDPATGELRPVTSDDTCCLILELETGTPVQISLSTVTYAGRGHWLEIYGDEGTLILGNANLKDYIHGFTLQAARPSQPLQILPTPSEWQFERTYPDGRQAPFMGIVDRWVRSICQGGVPQPSLLEGVYSQLLSDLAWQSHERGCWMEVPSVQTVIEQGGNPRTRDGGDLS
jgi:predicted dehydrogenase